MFRFIIYDGFQTLEFPLNPFSAEFVPVQYRVESFEDASGNLQPAISFSKVVGSYIVEGNWLDNAQLDFFKSLPDRISGKVVKLITHRKESYKVILSESRLDYPSKTYSLNFIVFGEEPAFFWLRFGYLFNEPVKYRVSGGVVTEDYRVTLSGNESVYFYFPSFVIGKAKIRLLDGTSVETNYLDSNPGGVKSASYQAPSAGTTATGFEFFAAPENAVFGTFQEYSAYSVFPNSRLKEFQTYVNATGIVFPVPRHWIPREVELGVDYFGSDRTPTISGVGSLDLTCGNQKGIVLPPRTDVTSYSLHIGYFPLNSYTSAFFNIDYSINSAQVHQEFALEGGLNKFTVELPLGIDNNFIKPYITGSGTFPYYKISEVQLYHGRKVEELNSIGGLTYTYLLDPETEGIEIAPAEVTGGVQPAYLSVSNDLPAELVGDLAYAQRVTSGSFYFPYIPINASQELLFDSVSSLAIPPSINPTSISKTTYLVLAQLITPATDTNITINFKEGTTVSQSLTKTIPGGTETERVYELGQVSLFKDLLDVYILPSNALKFQKLWLLPLASTFHGSFNFPVIYKKITLTDSAETKMVGAKSLKNGIVYSMLVFESVSNSVSGYYSSRVKKNV